MTLLAALLLTVAAPSPAPPAPPASPPVTQVDPDKDFSKVPVRKGHYESRHGASGTAIYVDPFNQVQNIV